MPTIDDVFGVLVAYEVYALATGRFPPVTRMCRQHRALCLPVLAIILGHLAANEREKP